MFAQLPEAPIDPILGMAQAFARDPSPDKVDLGIGIYKDEHGEVIVLPTVKAAERALVEGQSTKRYLSSAGNPEYNERTRGLLFREGSDAHARARTIQTVGGTGALRVAADFIGKFGTGKRIFLPDPTWANHPAIFGVAGFEIVNYPYYDIATGTLKLDEMMSALADLRAGDTVLLHGCCHNPSGADPSAAQWAEIADAVARGGHGQYLDCILRQAMRLHQPAARFIGPRQGQLAAPGAYLQRANIQGCCLHTASSMIPGCLEI